MNAIGQHVAGLSLLALKHKLTVAQREELELAILVNFDACKRNSGTNYGANVVSKHLLIAQCIASMKKNKPLYDLFCRATKAISTACYRPGDNLGFTTSEYAQVKDGVVAYIRHVLPIMEWKQFIGADAHVSDALGIDALAFIK